MPLPENIFTVRADHRIDRDETGEPMHGSVTVSLVMMQRETRMGIRFMPNLFNDFDDDQLVQDTMNRFDHLFSQMRRLIEVRLREEWRLAKDEMKKSHPRALPTELPDLAAFAKQAALGSLATARIAEPVGSAEPSRNPCQLDSQPIDRPARAEGVE